jgi:MFS family permease
MVPVANRILIDLGPLRERRGFRLLFAGQLVGVFGTEFTAVAIPFQVYGLTQSSLQVGLVSLAQLIPLIAGALIGGAVGDAVDRRRILLVTVLHPLTTTGGAFNAAPPRPSLVMLYLVSAAAAGLGGVLSTASYAAVPALVGRGQLVAAYASVQVVDQVGLVAGPALAGLLIAAVHLAWVYALAAGVYLLTTVTVLPIPAIPPVRGADRPGLGSIVAGFRYLRGRQVLRGVYLIDLNAMVFGMPRALFPALAASVFRGGASTLGFLYAAPAAGALVGALTTGWLERIRRQAWAVIAAVCVWGAAIVAFGVVHLLWAALALLAVAGWADVISAVLRSAILQTSVPEAFRSRISSVQIAVVEGGPRLGDLESGAVASLVSTEFAIISGGLACIVGAILLASRLPEFRHYDRCAPAPTGALAPAAAAEADHDLAPEG